jgi:hypothetical protein
MPICRLNAILSIFILNLLSPTTHGFRLTFDQYVHQQESLTGQTPSFGDYKTYLQNEIEMERAQRSQVASSMDQVNGSELSGFLCRFYLAETCLGSHLQLGHNTQITEPSNRAQEHRSRHFGAAIN